MKKIFICTLLLIITKSFGQTFDGYGDNKLLLGGTLQTGATGIEISFEKGLSDLLSFGTSFGYAIQANNTYTNINFDGIPVSKELENPELITETFDMHFKLDAHLGKKIGLTEMSDATLGMTAGFRNIGLHTSYKYFITDDFGFFADFTIPLAKLKLFKAEKDYFDYYNQPVLGIGIIFNN